MEMGKNIIVHSFFVLYMLVMIIVLQIVLPLLIQVENNALLKDLKFDAARIFLLICGMLIIIGHVAYCGCVAIYLDSRSLFALFVPTIFGALILTHAVLIKCLISNLGRPSIAKYVKKVWLKHFNQTESFMSKLQSQLECCGMDGPTDYLLYMEKVHESCYSPDSDKADPTKLFLKGCTAVIYDHVKLLYYVAWGLSWFAIIAQLIGFVISAFILIRRSGICSKPLRRTLNT